MSEGSSERKQFEPTTRKLRKARERGQVAQSRDVVTALGTIAAILYLTLRADAIGASLRAVVDAAYAGVAAPDFGTALAQVGQAAGEATVRVVAPLLLLLAAIGIGASVAMTAGPVFSFEPILPKGEKISPGAGLKRLFGVRALLTFLMSLLKVALLMVALGYGLAVGLDALVHGPGCGIGCAESALVGVLRGIVLAMTAIMLAGALLDLLVQKRLFLREMRMTRTEMKQEHKEQEGDPQFRGRRRQLARRAVEQPTGLRLATFVISDGPGLAVALRYRDGETPVPVVVAKARGPAASSLLLRAPQGARVTEDPIAQELFRVEPGDYARPDLVPRLSQIMQRGGVL